MTDWRWHVQLPFPPSVNNLFPRVVRAGKIISYPSKDYTAWRKEADLLISIKRWKRIDVPVVVKIELTPKTRRARDPDNYGKAILDALVRTRILHDDNSEWIKAVTMVMLDSQAAAKADVFIRPAQNVVFQPSLPGLINEA